MSPTAKTMEFEKHRFDFSPSIVGTLTEFTAIHLHDNSKTFKAAWQIWTKDPDISAILTEEIDRLHQAGFEGDVLQKMYASARYYLRKKLTDDLPAPISALTNCPKFSREFLQIIDNDAIQQINNVSVINSNRIRIVSQAEAYAAFCYSNQIQIYQEFTALAKKQQLSLTIVHKLKKTYKRRFYQIRLQQDQDH